MITIRIILFLLIATISFGQMNISTTIFPVYDGVKEIGGDKVEVTLLVKPGVEPHSFEPTPRDIININNSDRLFYLDESMETWIEKFKKNVSTETFSVSKGITFNVLEEEEDDDHDHHHHHHHDSKDPHIWLDPVRYQTVIKNIYMELSKLDPKNKSYYEVNYNNYIDRLKKLDDEFNNLSKNVRFNTIYYAGHFSFGYFTERYNLKYVSIYKNLSPNAGISPKDMQRIIKLLKDSNQEYFFKEALVNSKASTLIAEETSLKPLLLHQMGSISKKELKENLSYMDLMNLNLENLKRGLRYE